MNRIMRTLVIAVALLMVSTIAFATGTTEQGGDEPVTLNLYVNALEPAPEDELVYDYVEEQVLAASGMAIDLNVATDPTEEFVQKLNLLIASQDIDAWNWSKEAQYLGDSSLLAPLDDALDAYGQNVQSFVEDWQWETVTVDGVTRAIPIYENSGYFVGGKVVWIRTDLLEEFGMEYEEIMSLSEFERYLELVNENHPELTPIGRTSSPQQFTNDIMRGLGVPADATNADGTPKQYFEWVFPYEPEFEERLETLNGWWQAGFFHPEWFVWPRSRAQEIVRVEGTVGSAAASWWDAGAYFIPLREDKGQEWKMIALAREDGLPMYASTYRQWDSRTVYILDSSQKENEIVSLLDWVLASPDNSRTVDMGIPGTHWEYSDDGQSINQIDGLTWGDHQKTVYSGALAQFGRGWTLETGTLRNPPTPETQSSASIRALDPDLTAVAYPDSHINYLALENLKRELDLEFSETDAATFLEEVETRAILGEITPAQAVQQFRDYLDNNGFQEYWDAKMDVYRAESGM